MNVAPHQWLLIACVAIVFSPGFAIGQTEPCSSQLCQFPGSIIQCGEYDISQIPIYSTETAEGASTTSLVEGERIWEMVPFVKSGVESEMGAVRLQNSALVKYYTTSASETGTAQNMSTFFIAVRFKVGMSSGRKSTGFRR